jgi:hypothetical protein
MIMRQPQISRRTPHAENDQEGRPAHESLSVVPASLHLAAEMGGKLGGREILLGALPT